MSSSRATAQCPMPSDRYTARKSRSSSRTASCCPYVGEPRRMSTHDVEGGAAGHVDVLGLAGREQREVDPAHDAPLRGAVVGLRDPQRAPDRLGQHVRPERVEEQPAVVREDVRADLVGVRDARARAPSRGQPNSAAQRHRATLRATFPVPPASGDPRRVPLPYSSMGRAVTETLSTLSDPVFALHEGGKLEVRSTAPLRDAADLSLAYTPGVARVCLAIAEDPALAARYTWTSRLVAVVTDGTAVLGLGDIGPAAVAAGDGGQGAACSASSAGCRRGADRAGHHRRRRDRRDGRRGSRRPSAASTWRTSARRAASRSRTGCASCSTSRSSTTTSTAPRSSCWPRCATPPG